MASVADGHRALAGLGVIHPHLDIRGQAFELLDGGRALHVGRHQVRLAALGFEAPGNLGGGGGFAGPLQAHQHDGHRRPPRQVQLGGFPAQERGELLVDDLDDLLGRRQGPEHFLTYGPLPDLLDEALGDLVIDVGLQQGKPHLPQGLGHLGLGEVPPAFELLKDLGQLVGESVKHFS